MEYKYLYQTKENENREGVVKAASRADAYAVLRKKGIRPYRLIGDDPPKWRRPATIASAAAAVAAAAAALAVALRPPASAPLARMQIPGDPALLSASLASAWEDVFPSALDRHLAAYAQPGWLALAPEETPDEKAFARELEEPPAKVSASDPEHVRTVKRIVAGMRAEMEKYLADGGSVGDYLAFLDERQDEERALRAKAAESVEKAPADMRERARLNVNARLREMGLAEIPKTPGER